MTAKELTPQQELFLDALGGAAKGDYRKAKDMAGYSANTTINSITKGLADEILELTKNMMVMYGPKAAHTYEDILTDKAGMNAREKLNTANQILDRIGLVKKEQIEVEAKGASIVLLPAKKPVDYDNLY